MANVATVDLDWEPEVDDPDDSLHYDVYTVTNDDFRLFWGDGDWRSGDWTSDINAARRYLSKEEAEFSTRFIKYAIAVKL